MMLGGGAILTSIAGVILSDEGGAYQLLGMMLFCSLAGLAAALVVLRINQREGGGDPQIPVN
jgi:DHA1 family bicyclomycin/chloramphenicol resistance-like MFS transporter